MMNDEFLSVKSVKSVVHFVFKGKGKGVKP
jgi:hypothetical protein